MSEKTAKELAQRLRTELNKSDDTDLLGAICVIWLCGVLRQFVQLGITGGGQMVDPPGAEYWEEIDCHRFHLLPPLELGYAIGAFVETVATEEIRSQLAEAMAVYYTESGRSQVIKSGLDRLVSKDS